YLYLLWQSAPRGPQDRPALERSSLPRPGKGTRAMTCRSFPVLAATWLLLASSAGAADQSVSLTMGTVVVSPAGLGARETKAVQMLIDEVEKRTLIRWAWTDEWPRQSPAVVIGPAAGVRQLLRSKGVQLPEDPTGGAAEGYQIGIARGEKVPV